jgi:hypothetical protein
MAVFTPLLRPPFPSNSTLAPNVSASASSNSPVYILPAIHHGPYDRLLRPKDDIQTFLRDELCVPRLNRIHSYLWLAGRQIAARPLHRQAMMSRRITVTEQVDLHLAWSESCIFVKPLPVYLLDYQFWEDNLCNDSELYESARGFLLSYAWLISREIDFIIASDSNQRPRLLPPCLTWPRWVSFIESFLSSVDLDDSTKRGFNRRYQYGELRINRLNSIYRLAPVLRLQYFIRGYYVGYNRYDVFFQRNFAWLIVVFAYVSIVLTAMQVGLVTDNLAKDSRFQSASYGFAVFSIVVPFVVVGVMIFVFLVLFLHNFWATVVSLRRRW